MSEIATVGLDLAKNVFVAFGASSIQAHGVDAAGNGVLRKKLRRAQVLEFFGSLPPCTVAMEACGGAHFWGREIGQLGHEVRLIPPALRRSHEEETCALGSGRVETPTSLWRL